jgi:hypothetical protein
MPEKFHCVGNIGEPRMFFKSVRRKIWRPRSDNLDPETEPTKATSLAERSPHAEPRRIEYAPRPLVAHVSPQSPKLRLYEKIGKLIPCS